jgi:hypothetical protein
MPPGPRPHHPTLLGVGGFGWRLACLMAAPTSVYRVRATPQAMISILDLHVRVRSLNVIVMRPFQAGVDYRDREARPLEAHRRSQCFWRACARSTSLPPPSPPVTWPSSRHLSPAAHSHPLRTSPPLLAVAACSTTWLLFLFVPQACGSRLEPTSPPSQSLTSGRKYQLSSLNPELSSEP